MQLLSLGSQFGYLPCRGRQVLKGGAVVTTGEPYLSLGPRPGYVTVVPAPYLRPSDAATERGLVHRQVSRRV
jgi:hypothetical protein